MYLISVAGSAEREVDLSGVYRAVAMANPHDRQPMTLTAHVLAHQLTLPAGDSLIPQITREAMHRLVWGAATGDGREYTFGDGTVVKVRSVPGTEHEERRELVYGEARPAPERGGVDVRRSSGVRRGERTRRYR